MEGGGEALEATSELQKGTGGREEGRGLKMSHLQMKEKVLGWVRNTRRCKEDGKIQQVRNPSVDPT